VTAQPTLRPAAQDHVATGRVLQVSISAGGVPKHAVPEAHVGLLGLDGDRHTDDTVHGGPHRSVCLLANEVIQRVADEGNPIEPGSVGENITTEGFELALLPPGTRLAIGEELVLELSEPANPCDTIAGSFHDGRSGRISILTHPRDSRMYARTLHEGTVRPGDTIRVLPAAPDSQADAHFRLFRLEDAEGRAEATLWQAAVAGGHDVRFIDDGELRLVTAPTLPGPTFNRALGHRTLPNLLPRMLDHFRANEVVGWVIAERPPWPGAIPESGARLFTGDASAVAETAIPMTPGLEIRSIDSDEARLWAARLIDWSPIDELNARAWMDLATHLAAAPGMTLLVASVDGVPAAVSGLFTRIRVGVLRHTAVAPEFRGRGIQRALVSHRARRAVDHGALFLVASASEGSVSDGNLQQMGLEPIWRREKYRFDPENPPAGLPAA
jgi:MOSC domain-containing protein YiiM/GNAT superfamily N-acetyltransferase